MGTENDARMMSAVLFNIAIDSRAMKETMERRIRWTLFSSLEDIDFADDVAFLPHTRHDLQEKTCKLNDMQTEIRTKNQPNEIQGDGNKPEKPGNNLHRS